MQHETKRNISIKALTLLLGLLLSVIAVGAHGQDRSSLMTNNSIGHPYSESAVESPVDYFAKRTQALALVRQENWRAAKPLIESLTSQYPDDGDTWYIQGVTHFQLKEWKQSIAAFEKTLALGTILSGIPTGSAPSNDIMIKIAEAYAELEQETNAIAWIRRSLHARYDDKHQLAHNHHFDKIADSATFQKVIGSFLPENLTREQSWRYDLQYLASEIKRLHVNTYHSVSKARFEQMVTNIDEKIPLRSDQQIVFEFMTLVSALGNGHNFLLPTFNEKGAFNQLPLQFYHFSDGLFIVGADSDYQRFIGHKVIAIGETKVDEALSKIKTVNARST